MTYKPELKIAIIKLLNEFFEIERGNRVTGFNMDGLLMKMHSLFDKYEVADKADTGDGT